MNGNRTTQPPQLEYFDTPKCTFRYSRLHSDLDFTQRGALLIGTGSQDSRHQPCSKFSVHLTALTGHVWVSFFLFVK